MGMKLALGLSIALVSSIGMLHTAPARADGPSAAYDNGGVTDASLDPGEERMTADEENHARMKDLSDAYHNGYNARAKEDAETYASLRDQLKHPPQQVASQQAAPQQASSQLMPPLPAGVPPGEGAQVKPVPRTQVAQRPLQQPQAEPQYQQAYQQPQYAPPAPPPQPVRYQPAPQYAAAPAYTEVTQEYQEPAYQEEAYEPPPPPPPQQTIQYVPVYAQAAYVPQPPVQAVMQPVVTIARPVAYPVYRPAYWAPHYRRVYTVRYGYGYPAQGGYPGWD
ncbi:hypothetical protein FAZ69_21660 [Trinickia terrae]|uniref:DUF4148 domain-containing protein n=1 Tax=Trinickia terrae TaxID=2571161 RepID=A0A4V5PLW6_9BURK|nr:hypothetical protein [Trinickia terrae]TKC85930.1 hypothetical protein FAZ69_21660 [Trinickia terrae]